MLGSKKKGQEALEQQMDKDFGFCIDEASELASQLEGKGDHIYL